MNVLEAIGLAESIAANGAPVSDFCSRNQGGEVLARYPAGLVEKYRWPSVAISRTTLHRLLMDEGAKHLREPDEHNHRTGHLGEPGPSLQATADELRGACREEKERKKALHAPQDDIQ
jgi:hypothetical protein